MHELSRQHGAIVDVRVQAEQRIGSNARCTGRHWTPAILLPERRAEKAGAQLRDSKAGKNEVPSEREEECLAFLAQGATNSEMAFPLNISKRTVMAHVTAILKNLGRGWHSEAMAWQYVPTSGPIFGR